MTADELREALLALDLYQMELARFLGVEGQTVRRWVAPGGEAPVVVGILLRLLLARPELAALVGLDRVRVRKMRPREALRHPAA